MLGGMKRGWVWVIAVVGLTLAGCGADAPSRFDLRTPGAHTGEPVAPTAVPVPEESATPAPKRKPVTQAEKRVIQGWADELRSGHVTAATRYFAVPSLIS